MNKQDLREELRLNLHSREVAEGLECCNNNRSKCKTIDCSAWKEVMTDIGPKGYCGHLSDPRLPFWMNEISTLATVIKDGFENIENRLEEIRNKLQ